MIYNETHVKRILSQLEYWYQIGRLPSEIKQLLNNSDYSTASIREAQKRFKDSSIQK